MTSRSQSKISVPYRKRKRVQFTYYKLGHVAGGTVVEVTLQGSAANVRLMDSSNVNNYKAGRRHRYHGGFVRKSPVRLQVPTFWASMFSSTLCRRPYAVVPARHDPIDVCRLMRQRPLMRPLD